MCNPLELAYLAVAQRAGVAPPIASFVALAVREHALRQVQRGSVASFDAEGLALWSRVISTEEVEAVIRAMVDKGLIVDGMVAGIPPRAMTSTERSQRRRSRLRAEAATACNDAPLHNVASVAAGAGEAKPLMKRGNGSGDATPSRARLKEGSEPLNQSSNLPDLEQERLHASKEARAARARSWLSTTMQYIGETRPLVARRLWIALNKLKEGEKRPVWVQRELDRYDAERRSLILPPSIEPAPVEQRPQRELPLMRSIEGGARPPPVPEMYDYRGEGIEPLIAVGD